MSCGGRLSGPDWAAADVAPPSEWYVTVGQTVAPRHRAQTGKLRGGEEDGDAVERNVVVPVHVRVGHLRGEPGSERLLRRGERADIRRRPCRVEAERAPLHQRERRLRKGHDDFDQRPAGPRCRGRAPAGEQCEQSGGKDEKAEGWAAQARMVVPIPPGYTGRPRGCGGIGRRARFRSVWASARGGSSPLIRIKSSASRASSRTRAVGTRPSDHRSRLRLSSASGSGSAAARR